MDNVRLRLDDPRAQKPGELQLLHQVSSQTRTVLRAKRNSGNPWNYAETTIETSPDESLYQISATNFGTPLAVITVNDYADTNFQARRIPFYVGADFSTMEYALPANAGQYFGGVGNDFNHVALRANITWRSNVPYIELLPVGGVQATYAIKYLENANGTYDAALTTSPVPAEDADLVECRAAKALLPLTEWEGNNDEKNRAKRRELYVSISDDERLAWEQFNASNLVTTGPTVKPRWSGSIVGQQ